MDARAPGHASADPSCPGPPAQRRKWLTLTVVALGTLMTALGDERAGRRLDHAATDSTRPSIARTA